MRRVCFISGRFHVFLLPTHSGGSVSHSLAVEAKERTMSVSPSKLVTDRQKSATVVLSTQVFIEPVLEGLTAHFPPRVRAPARSAVSFFVGLLYDWLDNRTDAMVQADIANAVEAADDQLVREARNEYAATVRAALVDLREVLVACYDKGALAQFGIDGRTPEDPVVLERAGQAALSRLRVFEPKNGKFSFFPSEWIGRFETPLIALRESLKSVAQDDRENQLALSEKNEAIARYDHAFRAVANILTGLFAAAGREELARRVRPSTRRPGQTAEAAPADSEHDFEESDSPIEEASAG